MYVGNWGSGVQDDKHASDSVCVNYCEVCVYEYHDAMYILIGTPQVPVITSHHQNVTIPKGHKITLEMKACGTMPLYYQWYYEHDILHGMFNHIVYMII